ncbi:MAG TPA: MoaD/ThiS family protein [Nakamurella sp.]
MTLRYWAAAREAAGVPEERLGPVRTLADLLAAAVAGPGRERLAVILDRCSFLVDENPVGTRDRSDVILRSGAVIEALPPFAGG